MPAFGVMLEQDQVTANDFPEQGTLEEQFRFLLRSVVLAPSTFNTQPWRFAVSDEGIAVYADYTRRMPAADPGNRELLMSVGAAVFNLRAAAARFGFTCTVAYNYNNDSERPLAFAALSPSEPEAAHDATGMLYDSILRRHTNRSPFLVTRIPSAVLAGVSLIGKGTPVSVTISTDGAVNQKVGDLVGEAERMLYHDADFRRNSAEWMRPGWSQEGDGVPGSALGMGGLTAAFAPWATKILDLGKVRAARDKNLCIDAPGLVVLSAEDTVPELLETGEVLEHVLLWLTREGLQTSYFNMPIKAPAIRLKLKTVLGLSSWPQLLLRIGYCLTEPAATPRRPIDEVIITRH